MKQTVWKIMEYKTAISTSAVSLPFVANFNSSAPYYGQVQ
jgi:hypothetical protein